MTQQVVSSIERWLTDVVIELNLCPFAASPWRQGSVAITVSEAQDFEAAIKDFLKAMAHLWEHPDTATTLVAFEHAFADFEEFLDAVDTAEGLISKAKLKGVFQLAHFHPEYVFDQTDSKDVTNYTNRAPYPVLHLIREADVSDAVDRTPDIEEIPGRNMERLRSLSGDALKHLKDASRRK